MERVHPSSELVGGTDPNNALPTANGAALQQEHKSNTGASFTLDSGNSNTPGATIGHDPNSSNSQQFHTTSNGLATNDNSDNSAPASCSPFAG